MNMKNKYINIFISIIVCMFLSGIIIAIMGEDPVEAYIQLFRGAFVGNFNQIGRASCRERVSSPV